MAKDTFTDSLWYSLTPVGPALPKLQGDVEADVAIVGAGFLGMTTALVLRERGVNVALIEAMEPGFGASGRNTGFVVPALKKALSPAQVEKRFGAKRGATFNTMIGRSGEILFDRLRRYGIDGQAEQNGWMQPAHNRGALAGCKAMAAEWQDRGFDVRLLDRGETEALIGLSGYHGALYIPTGGQLNPLAYARSLAAKVKEMGAQFFSHSPVQEVRAENNKWRVLTPSGSVVARKVVFCTNAMAGKLLPSVVASFIPAGSWQIATQPLSREAQERILPSRIPIADTRRHLFAARWSPDGRIVGGGLCYPGPYRAWRARRRFARRFQEFLPELGPLKAEFAWTGKVSMTLDAMPRLYELGPNLLAPLSCNGRGVALTAAFGTELASFIADETPADDFVVPLTRPDRIPARTFAGLAPYLWLPYSDFMDMRETEKLGPEAA